MQIASELILPSKWPAVHLQITLKKHLQLNHATWIPLHNLNGTHETIQGFKGLPQQPMSHLNTNKNKTIQPSKKNVKLLD